MLLTLPALDPKSPHLPFQFTWHNSVHSDSFQALGAHDAHFYSGPIHVCVCVSPYFLSLLCLLHRQHLGYCLPRLPSSPGVQAKLICRQQQNTSQSSNPSSLVSWTTPPQFTSCPPSQPHSQSYFFPHFFSPASHLLTCLFCISRHLPSAVADKVIQTLFFIMAPPQPCHPRSLQCPGKRSKPPISQHSAPPNVGTDQAGNSNTFPMLSPDSTEIQRNTSDKGLF